MKAQVAPMLALGISNGSISALVMENRLPPVTSRESDHSACLMAQVAQTVSEKIMVRAISLFLLPTFDETMYKAVNEKRSKVDQSSRI